MTVDGSWVGAQAASWWLEALTPEARSFVEQLSPGQWAVIIFRPDCSDALWVRPGEYLVFDERRRSRFEVLSGEEFNRCFERLDAVGSRLVRECPIFDDGEVAS